MTPTIYHVRDGRRSWWVVANQHTTTRGRAGETLRDVIARHEAANGPSRYGYVRIAGYCLVSEATADLMSRRSE